MSLHVDFVRTEQHLVRLCSGFRGERIRVRPWTVTNAALLLTRCLMSTLQIRGAIGCLWSGHITRFARSREAAVLRGGRAGRYSPWRGSLSEPGGRLRPPFPSPPVTVSCVWTLKYKVTHFDSERSHRPF